MKRKILKSKDGMLFTNGVIYGKEIYLAEDVDTSCFYEISEEEINELKDGWDE